MKRAPRLATVMTPFPSSIEIDQTAEKALQMMAEHQFHHLPITEQFRPVGVVNEAQIHRHLAESGKSPEELGLAELCSRDVVLVDISTPLDVVLQKMADQQLDSVLVTRGDKVAGIFTSHDACRVLIQVLREELAGPDDAA